MKDMKIQLINLFTKCLIFLDDKFPAIEPMNAWKLLFDSNMVLITILSIFLNTVEVFFDISFNDIYPEVRLYLRPILITFFFFSSFLNLNTRIS